MQQSDVTHRLLQKWYCAQKPMRTNYFENAEVVEISPSLQNYAKIDYTRRFVVVGHLLNQPSLFWSQPISKFAAKTNTFYTSDKEAFIVLSYGFTAWQEKVFRRSLFMKSCGAKVVTPEFLLKYGG